MTGRELRRSLGFTTQTFMNSICAKEISTSEAVRWAAEQGFTWVEIRDKNLELSQSSLAEIHETAKTLKLKLHYAWDGGNLLDAQDEVLFRKGIANATIFGADTLSRIAIATSQITSRPGKIGYTRNEFNRISKVIKDYQQLAQDQGVTIVYENSVEPLMGDGFNYFGIIELLEHNPEMKLTFDPANFLNKQTVRVLHNWSEVKKFFQNYQERIPYIHLKSTKDNILREELLPDGDIDLVDLIRQIPVKTYVCLELPALNNLEKCMQNVTEALNRLDKIC